MVADLCVVRHQRATGVRDSPAFRELLAAAGAGPLPSAPPARQSAAEGRTRRLPMSVTRYGRTGSRAAQSARRAHCSMDGHGPRPPGMPRTTACSPSCSCSTSAKSLCDTFTKRFPLTSASTPPQSLPRALQPTAGRTTHMARTKCHAMTHGTSYRKAQPDQGRHSGICDTSPASPPGPRLAARSHSCCRGRGYAMSAAVGWWARRCRLIGERRETRQMCVHRPATDPTSPTLRKLSRCRQQTIVRRSQLHPRRRDVDDSGRKITTATVANAPEGFADLRPGYQRQLPSLTPPCTSSSHASCFAVVPACESQSPGPASIGCASSTTRSRHSPSRSPRSATRPVPRCPPSEASVR